MSTPNNASAPLAKRRRLGLWQTIRILLICVLLTELGLRLILGLGNPVIYQADPDCGFLPVANQDTTRFFSHVHINAFNMRSPEIPLHKTPGTVRILLVGDSVTFGPTRVDQALLFASRLGAELPGKMGRPVEVLNASCGSWAVANELGYLRSRGTFEADLVVFVLNTEDLVQPFGPYVEHIGVPSHKPFTAIGELTDRYLLPRLGFGGVPADLGSNPSQTPDIADATPRILEQLGTAHDCAEARRARFAVVYSPAHNEQWDKPIWQQARGMLAAWAASHQVPLIDLTADFSSHDAAEIWFDGIHLRPLGHQIVAERLDKEIPLLLTAATPAKPDAPRPATIGAAPR